MPVKLGSLVYWLSTALSIAAAIVTLVVLYDWFVHTPADLGQPSLLPALKFAALSLASWLVGYAALRFAGRP